MFRSRLGSVFMIYYFNAIKSLVDTKAKNSLASYPAAGYLRGHCGWPSLHAAQKKAFWFCWQSLWREIMEKIKTPIIILPPSLLLAKLCLYDRLYDKWHVSKSVVEDGKIPLAANKPSWPFFFIFTVRDALFTNAASLFDVGADIKWWQEVAHPQILPLS